MNALKKFASVFLFFSILQGIAVRGQNAAPKSELTKAESSADKYVDQNIGKTADELVAMPLLKNHELEAIRREVDASAAMIKQADLRANPMLEVGAAKNPFNPSKSVMVKGSLPLELYGRRGARVDVAEKETAVRRADLENRERLAAADVRAKFGETVALALKLKFIEEILSIATQNYELIAARVREGKNAPLEQNMELVELNRIRALRESSEGKVEISMFELKNMIGISSEENLVLKDNFADLLEPLAPQITALEFALQNRPDLKTVREIENLADAQIKQAKIQGKLDASVSAGYERMRQGFPQRGFDADGSLTQISELANVFSVGVTLNLPVFDRNQGAVEAGILSRDAAANRVEFGELTVKREVFSSYSRYQRAARAMEIFRVGVEDQAEVNVDVVRQSFELGSKSLLDYISEQRRFIEINESYIDIQLETYLARVEVLKATASPELVKK